MDKTLGNFVAALRKADLEVSPAETLDAVAALEIIGIKNRQLLRETLLLVLVKTPGEKDVFNSCFNRFFTFDQFTFGTANRSFKSNILDKFDIERQTTTGNQISDQALMGALISNEIKDGNGDKKSKRNRVGKASMPDSHLGKLILAGDESGLLLSMIKAAKAVHLENIKTLRERSIYAKRILLHMGLTDLENEIQRLREEGTETGKVTMGLLKDAKFYLQDQVKSYVEEQYLLLIDGTGNRFLREAVSKTKLTGMQTYYFDHIREAVRKLAHQLAKQHARKKKIASKGRLDLRKTLRKNLAYDGNLFDLYWKQIKLDSPRIFVICDVSGSVRNVARFLLTFLYSLNELLPKVRSFAFSGELGEVTSFFENYSLHEAVEMTLEDYGKGSTDYGQAFSTFKENYLKEVDSRSTVIVLGDSRNNYFSPGTEMLKQISDRSKQLVWLNPEPRERWKLGDAEMASYLPYCHYSDVCNSLKDLERMASRVLRTASN